MTHSRIYRVRPRLLDRVMTLTELGARSLGLGSQMTVDSIRRWGYFLAERPDPGDDPFAEPLEMLLRSLRAEANLSLRGQTLAARFFLPGLLRNRILARLYRRTHPESQQALERPIFIVGPHRSGSTFLHRLLAQHPQLRVPLTWEVTYNGPKPGRSARWHRDKVAVVNRLSLLRMPGILGVHEYDVDQAEECTAPLLSTFASDFFGLAVHVPSYLAWHDALDMGFHRLVYREYREHMEVLQHRKPAGRWLLKSPTHWANVGLLVEQFPEARFLVTHREPTQFIPSLASMVTLNRGLFSDVVDRHLAGVFALERYVRTTQQYLAARQELPGDWFYDVTFQPLIQQPLQTARQICEWLGLDWNDEIAERMQLWMQANRRENRPRHRYTLEEFGLAAEQVQTALAEYIESSTQLAGC